MIKRFLKTKLYWKFKCVDRIKGNESMIPLLPVHYTEIGYKRADNIVVVVCLLFELRFYVPVIPMGSCRARSVYLSTLLLGRLSPLSG